ncbi:MAG: ATP-dependent 6-phosphofructokinase, partial [Anaerovoracaceae bacterium]
TKASVGDIMQRGGTVLKTARSGRFLTFEGQGTAVKNLRDNEIDALVAIGGDGTFKGALDLHKLGIPVICIPGTVDNDMGYTDYTIGFDTAVNTVLDAIGKIRDTASAHERTTIIEVMGRNCGDIALYSGVTGGADYILLPEVKTEIHKLCTKINEGLARGKKHSIIIKAEGVELSNRALAEEIEKHTGQEAKEVVLAYLQRGGSPSARDRMLASLMGSKAVELIQQDITGKAIAIRGSEIKALDLQEAVSIRLEADLELLSLIDVLSK